MTEGGNEAFKFEPELSTLEANHRLASNEGEKENKSKGENENEKSIYSDPNIDGNINCDLC